MAYSFAQEDPLNVALMKTFDGQHPCSLCKVVKEGQQTESKKSALAADIKVDFFLDRQTAFLPPSFPCSELPAAPDEQTIAWRASPPVPPPRQA